MSAIERALVLLEEEIGDEDMVASARYELSDMRDIDRQLREDRAELLRLDAERLARCAAESRRLSLEECCYWLLLCGEVDAAEDMADRRQRQPTHAAKFRRWARTCLRGGPYRHDGVRRNLFCSWLCREALRRIEEERR